MERSSRLAMLAACLAVAAAFSPAGRAADAEPLDLDELRGKVVILDFWASWCVPCRRSFPWLNVMHDKYGADGLVIVGVNLDNDPAEADAFLREYLPRFRIHFDRDNSLARRFGVMAMPSSYLIGRDGALAGRHLGFKVKKAAEYESAIVALLGAEGEK